jgi:hypothetical protein
MSDERRTISINPELFQMTKKKRPASSTAPKIRPYGENNNNKTVRRSAKVLRMIREQQEKNFRRLLENDVNVAGSVPAGDLKTAIREGANVDGDFQESLDYLMSLAEQEAQKQQQQQQQQQQHMNATLKNRLGIIDTGVKDPDFFNNENVSLVMPEDMMSMPVGVPGLNLRPPMPKWGCLKNGSLPSYRQWTQKNRPGMGLGLGPGPGAAAPAVVAPKPFYTSPLFLPQNAVATLGQHSQGHIQDCLPMTEISQTMNAVTETTREPLILPRQQRTVRRTHYVGKNKNQSEVSILVSNKTIRNRIVAKTHEIRQKPIEDVKRYLINKGFVRVGTSAPNDVLRKMYETAQLVCGEIQNHNPENLLFNFMNVGK